MSALKGLNPIQQGEMIQKSPGLGKLGGKGLPKAGEFDAILRGQLAPQPGIQPSQKLTFSNHAVERMRSRGVNFDKLTMNRIEQAIDKARTKGSKDTLVLTDNAALIVNVNSSKVVTVMDRAALKENVFTNIDSTVVL